MAIKHSGRTSAHHATTGAEDRGARLAVSLSGTNLARAGDYNQRIVLQAIRIAGETSRSALADTTGLTAPTIANITRRLLNRGLIVEAGRHQGARGQPAVRLTINPAGCFAVGINIDRDHLTIVSIDLSGRVLTRMSCEIAFAMPDTVATMIAAEMAVIRASGLIDERRLLGVGVAVPDDLGRVPLPHRPAGYDVWNDLDVAALVAEVVPWPVHIDNDAAAAAIGEAQFGSGLTLPSFFYVLISAGLGGGLIIDGSYVRGARGRGGEIGFLPDASIGSLQTVQATVSLSTLYARLEAAGCPVDRVDDLVSEEPMVADVVAAWLDDAARSLTAPLIAVNCIVDPGAILIGGRLPTALVEALVDRLDTILHVAELPSVAHVGRATMSDDAPAIGAAVLPFLDNILPSDIILMQTRRDYQSRTNIGY